MSKSRKGIAKRAPALSARLRQRASLGLPDEGPLEYHFREQRPLTSDELRFAEDTLVLEYLDRSMSGPTALHWLAGGLGGAESVGDLVLDWGGSGEDAARCARLRPILTRLREAKLVQLVGRRWAISRKGKRSLRDSKEPARDKSTRGEVCLTCFSRVPPGALIRAANRRTREKAPTACLGCAEMEKRPFKIEIARHAAVAAFSRVVDAHADAAIAQVPNGVMVNVDEAAVLGELITREAKRLRAGGQLPKLGTPGPGSSTHGLWREPKKRARKGKRS